jgi:hypothetical protein
LPIWLLGSTTKTHTKRFIDENVRGDCGDPAKAGQHAGLTGVIRRRVTFGLHLADHVCPSPAAGVRIGLKAPCGHALDLRLHRPWKLTVVTGAEQRQSLVPIPARRLKITDALRHEQALDPIHVLRALPDETLALARLTATILFLQARHPHHPADLRLAAPPARQGARSARPSAPAAAPRDRVGPSLPGERGDPPAGSPDPSHDFQSH